VAPKENTPADFYVAFGGNNGQRNYPEPKLGEQVEYTIFGTVRGIAETIRDDGETRVTYKVDVEAAWPKGSTRPDTANQGTLVDHEGNVTEEAGGELIDTAGAADDE
jgi:hypothetical protein